MTSLSLRLVGDPLLRQRAAPVGDLQDPSLQTLTADLLQTCESANGVGIAAPQVGKSLQVVIVASRPNPRYPDAPWMESLVMINPVLGDRSEALQLGEEGCLSVPGQRGLIWRHQAVEVQYLDAHGSSQRRWFDGFPARIVQHELDHLTGRLFIDQLAPLPAPA
jgi:peptide deformylase